MVRRVFFSYAYEDIARAKDVRKCWLKQGKGAVGFKDKEHHKQITKKYGTAIRDWIGSEIARASVTVVLLGEKTSDSKRVKYEIKKSKEIGNALLAIDISKNTSKKSKDIPLLKGYDPYNWEKDQGTENIGAWVEKAAKDTHKLSNYDEGDLHSLAAYFTYTNPVFNRYRNIGHVVGTGRKSLGYTNPAFNLYRNGGLFTKTIKHQVSEKSKPSAWNHPDMVGIYFPDQSQSLIEFNRISDNKALKVPVPKLFSFELKQEITPGDYTAKFFQAVCNSSWANEGYLVAAEIDQDIVFRSELGRLSRSFGIGIIHLKLDDIDSSYVLFQSKVRPQLDWEAMSMMYRMNPDFKSFVQNIKFNFNSKQIHTSQYDQIIADPYVILRNIRRKYEKSDLE